MALSKNIDTPYGIPATYWHILAINANRLQGGMSVLLAGYASKDMRDAGKVPLHNVEVPLVGGEYPGTGDGLTYAAIYAAIKAKPEWADAENA